MYKISRFVTPGLAIYSYLIADESSQAVAIDPTRKIEPLLQQIKQERLNLKAILETHVHADFISGSRELKELVKRDLGQKAEICCSGLGGSDWIPNYADRIIQDRESIFIGPLRLEAWHTPGHTPEHLMWVLFDASVEKNRPLKAFTGDLLFYGSVGRPDLLGEVSQKMLSLQLYCTIFQLLQELPDSVEVFPAHGAGSLCGKGIKAEASSTLGKERLLNPFLLKKEKDKWIEDLLRNMPPPPTYFKRIKELNIKGVPLMNALSEPRLLSPEEMSKLVSQNEVFILDIRSKEAFAIGHIRGALNIPWSESFINWASSLLSPEKPFALMASEEKSAHEATLALRLIGLDLVKGYLLSVDRIENIATLPLMNPLAVYQKMQELKEKVMIIDVRTLHEWECGHIPGAFHIELTKLKSHLKDIPRDKTIGLVCASGSRASTAASLLKQKGFADLFNIEGGTQGWIRVGLPIQMGS